MKEGTVTMHWRITPYTVSARSREAARRKLAAAIRVPLWTLR